LVTSSKLSIAVSLFKIVFELFIWILITGLKSCRYWQPVIRIVRKGRLVKGH
jgi:hypothetical protein